MHKNSDQTVMVLISIHEIKKTSVINNVMDYMLNYNKYKKEDILFIDMNTFQPNVDRELFSLSQRLGIKIIVRNKHSSVIPIISLGLKISLEYKVKLIIIDTPNCRINHKNSLLYKLSKIKKVISKYILDHKILLFINTESIDKILLTQYSYLSKNINLYANGVLFNSMNLYNIDKENKSIAKIKNLFNIPIKLINKNLFNVKINECEIYKFIYTVINNL